MSFFEDIAAALDAEGIESRVNDETLFVPVNSEFEIQFVEIDPELPAANVYFADANVDEEDEDYSATLIAVVFSVADAVAQVGQQVANTQMITVLDDLLAGTDDRIADLEFLHDERDPMQVAAEVGDDSELQVRVSAESGQPAATVKFVKLSYLESDELRPYEAASSSAEILELGTFTDFDRLFDVLSLAADQAEDWEEQLDSADDDFGFYEDDADEYDYEDFDDADSDEDEDDENDQA